MYSAMATEASFPEATTMHLIMVLPSGSPPLPERPGNLHGLGVGAGNHLVGHFDFPGIQGIKNQDQSHDFS